MTPSRLSTRRPAVDETALGLPHLTRGRNALPRELDADPPLAGRVNYAVKRLVLEDVPVQLHDEPFGQVAIHRSRES